MDDLARAVAQMAGFVRAWRADAPDRPVVGLGYSNGANILAATLFEHADLFDAVALMHPLIPWTPAPDPALFGKRALVTSGARDPICPPETTDALIGYLEGQGVETTAERHSGGHEVRPEELVAARHFLAKR